MDFVVSKVAMSICALVVVAVLTGIFDGGAFVDRDGELSEALESLSRLLERAAISGSELKTDWKVPLLADGGLITVEIRAGILSAESGSRTASVQPACPVHTWIWDGSQMNSTAISDLDISTPGLTLVSGMIVQINGVLVTVENEQTYLVFASRAG